MTGMQLTFKVREKIIELRDLLNMRFAIDMTDSEFKRLSDISDLIDKAGDKIL